MSDDDSESVGMDFRGDPPPIAMDSYRDNVISARQQSILNELRIDMCHEDMIYLNNHKEVEAIVTLLLMDMLKKCPHDHRTHAARFVKDPRTARKVANFSRTEDRTENDLLRRDAQIYSTFAVTVNGHGTRTDGK